MPCVRLIPLPAGGARLHKNVIRDRRAQLDMCNRGGLSGLELKARPQVKAVEGPMFCGGRDGVSLVLRTL